MRRTGGFGQESASLEEESRASAWSGDVWFPGASVGMPGRFGRHSVFALPSAGLSVSILLSGNNGRADEVDSSGSFVRDQALLFLRFLPPFECFLIILIFNIWKIAPKEKK